MQISSLFFSIQTIAKLAAPEALGLHKEKEYFEQLVDHRIEFLSTDEFNIHFFTSLTNLRFIMVTSTGITNIKPLFGEVYKAFAQFVIKDPNFTVG